MSEDALLSEWKVAKERILAASEAIDELGCPVDELRGEHARRMGKSHFGVYDPVARTYSRFFEFSNEEAKIDERGLWRDRLIESRCCRLSQYAPIR